MRPTQIHPFLFVCFMSWGQPSNLVAEQTQTPVQPVNRGPTFVIIRSSVDTEKIPKPAYLPHRAHQWLECDGCHHSKGPDGKKIDTIIENKIEKCETCHNSTIELRVKVATLKRASHRLCMECHRQQDKKLSQCDVCHKAPSNQE